MGEDTAAVREAVMDELLGGMEEGREDHGVRPPEQRRAACTGEAARTAEQGCTRGAGAAVAGAATRNTRR